MSDLSAMTAKTRAEFAMFTCGNRRMIVRGNSTSVRISPEEAKKLASKGYKFSGHTHPGTSVNVLQASEGDCEILKAFWQERSVVYNSKGQHMVYYCY